MSTTISIPNHPGASITVARDDDPVPTVVVHNGEWEQELHVPVSVARQVAAAILAALD